MVQEVLSNTPIVKGLTDEELDILLQTVSQKHFCADKIIIEEGSVGQDLFILLSGKVRIETRIPSGVTEQQTLYTIFPGEVFGEFSFVDGTPRSASVISEEECSVLILNYDDFQKMARKHTHLALRFMENIANILIERIRNVNLEYRNAY